MAESNAYPGIPEDWQPKINASGGLPQQSLPQSSSSSQMMQLSGPFPIPVTIVGGNISSEIKYPDHQTPPSQQGVSQKSLPTYPTDKNIQGHTELSTSLPQASLPTTAVSSGQNSALGARLLSLLEKMLEEIQTVGKEIKSIKKEGSQSLTNNVGTGIPTTTMQQREIKRSFLPPSRSSGSSPSIPG